MSRLQILVVEDDESLRKVFRVLLFDHDIVEAGTLAEAQATRNQDFDVVICDWLLPDGNGGTLLRQLAADGDRAHRILYTGSHPPELDDLVTAGIVHQYLRKPAWRELMLSLAQLRPRRRSSSGRTPPPDRAPAEQRSESRMQMELTAFVRCESWHVLRRLYTTDLSQGGIALRSPEPAPSGAPVRIALTLPDGLRLRLKGEVRYSTAVYGADGAVAFKIGVRLHDSGDRSRLVLRSLLRAGIDHDRTRREKGATQCEAL
jgi:CheY-like chemotaxis protein